MFTIGRVCVKLAGRDAGKKCVIVDVLEGKYVMIEGQTRRRRCNMLHLEPLDQTIDIQKNAHHDTVMKALGHESIKRNAKPKTEKPKKAAKIVKKSVAPKNPKAEKPKKQESKKQESKK